MHTEKMIADTVEIPAPPSELPLALDNARGEVQKELGGRPGPDPTRYGDWEKNGRCIDF